MKVFVSKYRNEIKEEVLTLKEVKFKMQGWYKDEAINGVIDNLKKDFINSIHLPEVDIFYETPQTK